MMKHSLYLLLLFTATHTLRIFDHLEQTHFNFGIINAANKHNGEGFDINKHLTRGRGSGSHNNLLHFLQVQHQQDDSDDGSQSNSGRQQNSENSDTVGQTTVSTSNNNASSNNNYPNNPNYANGGNKDNSFNWQSLGSKVISNSNQIQKGVSAISGLIKPNDAATSSEGTDSSQSSILNPSDTPYLNPQDYDLLTSDYDQLDFSNILDFTSTDIELLDPSTIDSLDQI